MPYPLAFRRLPPQVLERGAALLGLKPALARARAGSGGGARGWCHRRPADQLDQALARIGAVALLGAMALRADDEHAVAGQSPAGEPRKPLADIAGEVRCAAQVEA